MKIRRNTADIFVAEEAPWIFAILLMLLVLIFSATGLFLISEDVWAGLFLGLVGGGMGVAAIGVFGERLQLIIDALAQTATLRSRTIFRHRKTPLALADVNKAIIETTHSDSNRRQTMSRPSLGVTESSDITIHPITLIYSSGNNAQTVVLGINKWLETLRSGNADIDSPGTRR